MTIIDDNTSISRRSPVVANDLSENETVMLDIDRGMYFGVKDVGKAIWNELAQQTTRDKICRALMERYDVDDETCRREVGEFLAYLLEQELIDVHSDDVPV